jgi:hypothetical protein
MRRISAMTLGFVLIFVGLQLHLVDTFVLTPRFSNLLSSGTTQFDGPQVPMNFNPNVNIQNPNQRIQQPFQSNEAYNSPYYQASFTGNGQPINQPPIQSLAPRVTGPTRAVSPPGWICWPVLFFGTVMLLHGISMRRN